MYRDVSSPQDRQVHPHASLLLYSWTKSGMVKVSGSSLPRNQTPLKHLRRSVCFFLLFYGIKAFTESQWETVFCLGCLGCAMAPGKMDLNLDFAGQWLMAGLPLCKAGGQEGCTALTTGAFLQPSFRTRRNNPENKFQP